MLWLYFFVSHCLRLIVSINIFSFQRNSTNSRANRKKGEQSDTKSMDTNWCSIGTCGFMVVQYSACMPTSCCGSTFTRLAIEYAVWWWSSNKNQFKLFAKIHFFYLLLFFSTFQILSFDCNSLWRSFNIDILTEAPETLVSVLRCLGETLTVHVACVTWDKQFRLALVASSLPIDYKYESQEFYTNKTRVNTKWHWKIAKMKYGKKKF